MTQAADPLQAHIDAAAPAGSAEALALLFAPARHQRIVGAVLAFAHQIGGIARLAPEAATMRLNWWREELGRYVHDEPGHPITRALHTAGLRDEATLGHLGRIVQAAGMHLDGTQYATLDALTPYLDHGFGSPCALLVSISGNNETLQPFVRPLGRGLGLAAILQATTVDTACGKARLPRALLDAGGTPAATAAASLIDAAVTQIDTAVSALPPDAAERQRCALVLAAVYRRRLANANAAFGPLRARPLSDLWLAWRTARHAARKAR